MTAFILFNEKSFSANDTTNYPISIKLKIEKEYFVTHSKDYYNLIYQDYQYNVTTDSAKEKRYDINLTIKNNSTKTIYIWLMTCSWSDNFIVNNDYIYMDGKDCEKNFPTLVKFKPGQSRLYITTLIESIKFDYPCKNCIYGPQVETTKLGLIIINDVFKKDDINMLEYDLLMNDKSRWTIVWSNPLRLLDKQPTPKKFDVYKN